MGRVVVSYSAGAASAVALKVCATAWAKRHEIHAINCNLSKDEHPDNARFTADVERWTGIAVERLDNPKYPGGIDDVFLQVRFIVGPSGAACTKRLKQQPADAYCLPDDIRVIGYTVEEQDRIDRMEERHPDWTFGWVLRDAGITKTDCYNILNNAGIELPMMYRLGYGHNNCIGCVKGGRGYWNKIRRDFPETFAKRAIVQREIGAGFGGGDAQFFLDELKPDEGRDQKEPDIECGVFCAGYSGVLSDAAILAGAKDEDRLAFIAAAGRK